MRYFILILAITITSCSTRKVNKTEIKETIVDTTKTTTVATENINTIETVVNNIVTISPADTSKPMVVNGKTYRNVILRHDKSKSNKEYAKAKKTTVIEQKGVVMNRNMDILVKETERTSFKWYWLLLLIIPLLWFYRKEMLRFVLS
jgi:uncharacterized membrane protein